jgi:signal transduction histidine kinase
VWWSVGLAAVGALAAATFAAVSGWSARDTLITLALAGGAALVASVGGAFVLRRLGGRSTRLQAMVIALSSVVVLVAGILAAAGAMFISSHDLSALIVVISVSTAIAIGGAIQMGDEMGRGHRGVGDLAEVLASGGTIDAASVDGPHEMRQLAELLADVSHRLEESRRRERALETSRREIVAWVSHDLRSPLATIRAMAEALDDGVVSDAETVARYHGQLRRDSERLSLLVDDLFELSRINSGTLELDRRPVCLTEVVADAMSAARTHADLKGVRLVDDVDELPRMEVASQEVTRVLHNLLDNAIRHTPAGGDVVVGGGGRPPPPPPPRGGGAGGAGGPPPHEAATIVVADQCGGIPEPDLSRVFDVAFRSDAARSKDSRGGGLGLAIAKGLVEAHAGSIDVGNEGDGCRFVVRLPRTG